MNKNASPYNPSLQQNEQKNDFFNEEKKEIKNPLNKFITSDK